MERNVPSAPVRPMYSTYGVPTRYTVHGGAPSTTEAFTTQQQAAYPRYTPESVFHPGDRKAPREGYRVDLESELRRQTGYALQRSHPMTAYIPHDATSPLYHVSTQAPVSSVRLKSSTPKFIHPDVGTQLFGNDTRGQLKGTSSSR